MPLPEERRLWVSRFASGYKSGLPIGVAICAGLGVVELGMLFLGWLSLPAALSLCGLGFFTLALVLVIPAVLKSGPWPTPERREMQLQLRRDQEALHGQPATH